MANSNSDKNENWGAIIIAIVFLFAGATIYLKPEIFHKKQAAELSSVEKNKSLNESINRNLKAADVRRELEVLKTQIENERAERIREFEQAYKTNLPSNLNIGQESHAESVMQDLENLQRRGDEAYLDPSDVIDRRIARDQALADYDRKYKKEYIRAFLRNAREQGLEVELNENLDVIGIREAPVEEPMRFPNSVSGQGGSAQ